MTGDAGSLPTFSPSPTSEKFPGWVMIFPSPTFSSLTKSESVPVVGIPSPSRSNAAESSTSPVGISFVDSTVCTLAPTKL